MGKPIPETDSLARYCGASKILDNKPIGAAFNLRPNEEYLSVNWLEFYNNDDRIKQIEKVVADVNRAKKTGSTSKLALFNMSTAIAAVKAITKHAIQLSATHEPISVPSNQSHAGLHGYLLDNATVENVLAEIVDDVVPARPVKTEE
mgnify:CR=1 FL=1